MESEKRKIEEIEEPKAKRFCIAETTNTTGLPLNEDMLIEIFSYLNTEDMVQVAKADEMFLSSCRQAFESKFRSKYIQLPIMNLASNEVSKELTVEFLHYFGENISKLEFTFDEDDPIEERIDFDLIVTHCSRSLASMKLCYTPTELEIHKCFEKLKTLNICYGFVDQSICQFSERFPMLEKLNIDAVAKKSNIARKIASLKRFSLNFTDDYSSDCSDDQFHIEELNGFINCNPQLKEFCLTIDDENIKTEDSVIGFCIEKRLPDDIIPEKMTVKLCLPFHVRGDLEHSKVLAQLKIPIDRIERLEVSTEKLNKQICAYIAQCVNLTVLKLEISIIHELFVEEAWLNLAECKLLTHLEITLNVNGCRHEDYADFVATAIRPYLKECRNLKTVNVSYSSKFRYASELSLEAIKRQIDFNIWSLRYETWDNYIDFSLKKL